MATKSDRVLPTDFCENTHWSHWTISPIPFSRTQPTKFTRNCINPMFVGGKLHHVYISCVKSQIIPNPMPHPVCIPEYSYNSDDKKSPVWWQNNFLQTVLANKTSRFSRFPGKKNRLNWLTQAFLPQVGIPSFAHPRPHPSLPGGWSPTASRSAPAARWRSPGTWSSPGIIKHAATGATKKWRSQNNALMI